jgi:hypothetical protein
MKHTLTPGGSGTTPGYAWGADQEVTRDVERGRALAGALSWATCTCLDGLGPLALVGRGECR